MKHRSISILAYWRSRILLPIILLVVTIIGAAAYYLNEREEYLAREYLMKIAKSVAEHIYEKIDDERYGGISSIVYDIGKIHDVVIKVVSIHGRTVASYPSSLLFMDDSIKLGKSYSADIYLDKGEKLGYVTVYDIKSKPIVIKDQALFVLMVLAILSIITSLWSLTFTKPLISDILKMVDTEPETKFHFQEIKDINLKLQSQRQKVKDLERGNAIAKTTQMLAHDVRKPFSILKIGLDMFSKAANVSEYKKVLNMIRPEVEKAMTSVNGMINDVMEIGRTTPPKRELVSVESIIESSLTEICRVFQEADINISYEFYHSHMLSVDPLKSGRIFSNILGNAFQAIGCKGDIWIKTKEKDDFMTVCIGNKGSFIKKEDIPNLFEAFFTKDKKGGTGLGLAIAHKVVSNHGGKIWCESSETGKTVEFYFSLPIDLNAISQTTARLCENTTLITQANKMPTGITKGLEENTSATIDIQIYKDEIIRQSNLLKRKIRLAVIDDEILYRQAIKDLIERSEDLSDVIDLILFEASEPLLAAFKKECFDFLICDIDLGKGSLNGFEIVKTLRALGKTLPICIHSNRSLPEDYAQSVGVGAQALLPKPLALSHLLKFIANALHKPNAYRPKEEVTGLLKTDLSFRPHIIFIDDNIVFRNSAQRLIYDANVTAFSTPEELFEKINNDGGFLFSVSAIIFDQNFEPLSRKTGIESAEILRKKYNFKNPIILSSNEEFADDQIKDFIDLSISKELKPWYQLKNMLQNKITDEEQNIGFYGKSHDRFSEDEKDKFYKLRHNVRGYLGNIEICTDKVYYQNLDSFRDDLRNISENMHKVQQYIPQDLFNKLKTSVDVLIKYPSNPVWSDISGNIKELKKIQNEIKEYHFFKDDWWKFEDRLQKKDLTGISNKSGRKISDEVLADTNTSFATKDNLSEQSCNTG
ncbi:MAG: hybrid sensor histidine kinase/response regulator, partial [Oligoflexales bacterium]|nr:hybrid sensor histidine kinase/response regulator [Oligoflexales bacterium]